MTSSDADATWAAYLSSGPTGATSAAAARRGWALYEKMGRPKYVCAPMVDQSELPFRLLTRRYGTTLAYTPMYHSRLFSESQTYRDQNFRTCAADRPVFVQFCGHDPETLFRAAKLVEDRCDAVDLNLGCPQGIARRGHYGSFLLDDVELLERIVRRLSTGLRIPVTCKIRLRSTDASTRVADTVELCRRLQAAGCCLLCVHGRTKESKQQFTGECDWAAIREIKRALSIPVFANGGIGSLADAERCIRETGVDGVMSSEALLENPALFSRMGRPCAPLEAILSQGGANDADDGKTARRSAKRARKALKRRREKAARKAAKRAKRAGAEATPDPVPEATVTADDNDRADARTVEEKRAERFARARALEAAAAAAADAEAAATTRALARMPTDRTASMAAHTEADASARGTAPPRVPLSWCSGSYGWPKST